ncbi:MAG: PEGA domain-containing protein [Methanoregula sp.]|nr:PEGA domain-containing protein [Methanoregula sp.]
MSRRSGLYTIAAGIFFAILIIILPVSAYSVALYGTGTGFNPELHNDSVVVVQSVPGSAGTELDSNISRFVQPSVDVIMLGGEDTFSSSTAEKIEAAVAEGKILVVTYPGNRLFNASLPAYNNGTVAGGQILELPGSNAPALKEIFSGLQTQFSLQGVTPEGEQVVARNGSVTVLTYDTGMPALLYGKFGKGYVIEWTTIPVPSYMSRETADTILDRLIIRLLPAPAPLPTTSVTPQNTSVVTTRPETTTTTLIPVPLETSEQTTGNVTVYSSPIGASILIDGIYYGTTPANLTGIQQGNHIIRLTRSGYFDYEGSLYVIPSQTSHAFGTLPPLNQIQASATPLSIIVPVVTAEPTQAKGMFENTSIIVAIIGVFTATIAAGATIFSHVMKAKKE